jgi:hypothetical protein
MSGRAFHITALALAAAALTVPVAQARPGQVGGTQVHSVRPDDRGVARGIGNAAQTVSSSTSMRPDDRGFAAGIGNAPQARVTASSPDSGTDWTAVSVGAVAGLALVMLIGGGVALTARRHRENVAV